jgi:hypothetical protein
MLNYFERDEKFQKLFEKHTKIYTKIFDKTALSLIMKNSA